MGRIGRGVVLAAGVSVLVAGCGEDVPEGGSLRPADLMAAAVLSGRDVPRSFLPAESQRVFAGLRPRDPDCARLLRLADVSDPGDVGGALDTPHGRTAFYRADPGASLVQHVFRLPPGRAALHIARALGAVAACPRIAMDLGADRVMSLYRWRMHRPENADESFAVRYDEPAPDPSMDDGRTRISLSVVMARCGGDLLVLAAPGAFAPGDRVVEKLAAKAVRRLRAARPRTSPAPSPAP